MKWLAVALAALALAYGAQLYSTMSNTVRARYEAPKRPLTVTILNDAGERVRRTHFGTQPYQHELTLPAGSYRARLEPEGLAPVERDFIVEGESTIHLSYR